MTTKALNPKWIILPVLSDAEDAYRQANTSKFPGEMWLKASTNQVYYTDSGGTATMMPTLA